MHADRRVSASPPSLAVQPSELVCASVYGLRADYGLRVSTGTTADARHRGRHERPAYADDDEECWPKGKAMGDRELLVVSGKVPQRRGLHMRLAQALYGDGSSDAQLAHAGFLALLMCNIVGVYWLLRSLKDSVFTTVVGIEYQVRARARARVGAGGRHGPLP